MNRVPDPFGEDWECYEGCVICGSSKPSCQGGLCPAHTYDCERCGHPENSFACKIRHLSIQHGWAKETIDG